MKSSELKKLIKESVREAIQEELKDILLEAVKTPRVTTIAETGPVLETVNKQQPTMTAEQKKISISKHFRRYEWTIYISSSSTKI